MRIFPSDTILGAVLSVIAHGHGQAQNVLETVLRTTYTGNLYLCIHVTIWYSTVL